jgi:hypothetical protein
MIVSVKKKNSYHMIVNDLIIINNVKVKFTARTKDNN